MTHDHDDPAENRPERDERPLVRLLDQLERWLQESGHSILVDGVPRKPVDLDEMLAFEANPANRHVADAYLEHKATGSIGWASTCFLALDHNRRGPGPPVLFESLFFAPDGVERGRRAVTLDQALLQHEALLAELRADGWQVIPRPPDAE